MNKSVNFAKTFVENEWFTERGMYTLFDGQYGSTGKGLLASFIAEHCGPCIDTVATNAGPNSGHTGYFDGEKILTQQIPVASIVMDRVGVGHACYLNGGAIIEPEILRRELAMYQRMGELNGEFVLHPNAALIKPCHQGDQHSDIASTGKGTGPATQDKIGRKKDAVVGMNPIGYFTDLDIQHRIMSPREMGVCFVETAQGWSLGINSRFYPYTTSRECSVAQALADMGVSPAEHRKSIACVRTYPIRVGNTPDGFSGDVYPDQYETTFEDLSQEPELTTVTQRVRRIFTWSWMQYEEMLWANKPDAIFLNFCNYMKDDKEVSDHVMKMIKGYQSICGKMPDFVLLGFGPYNEDIKIVTGFGSDEVFWGGGVTMDIHLPDDIKHYEPELKYFMDSMVQKLHINRHKGFVEGVTVVSLSHMLFGEMNELKDALEEEGQFEAFMEAVDVANMAWLLGVLLLRMPKDEFTEEQKTRTKADMSGMMSGRHTKLEGNQ